MAKRTAGYTRADQVMRIMEDRGYRHTGPRETLVRKVVAKDRHFTAEDLRRELPQVGRATVYRGLNLLVETGVLCRVLLENGSLHYQLSHLGQSSPPDLHGCCGVSQDLLGCDIDGMLQEKTDQYRFQMEGHRLEVYGRCDSCIGATAAAG